MQSHRRRTPYHSLTLRARRRRRARLMTALGVLVIAAIAGGFVYLMRAPFLRIQDVQVIGADQQSDAEIASYVKQSLAGSAGFLIPKNHVWEFSRSALRQSILGAFPRLSDADPSLRTPTSLTVAVSERLPQAQWCGTDAADAAPCRYLDQGGAAYAPAGTSSQAYVTYYGALDETRTPPQFLTPAQFGALSSVIDAIVSDAGTGPAASAAVASEGTVTVRFDSGFSLLFALGAATDNAAGLLQRLKLALQSAPFQQRALSDFEYLDLRFGDSLYYKLKDGTGAPGPSAD